jgi:hypothetical protein
VSAWIVSKTHIDALVQAGIEREMVRPDEADEFGRMLWGENLASIHYRYPDTVENGNYPGPNDFRDSDVDTYTYEPLDGEAGISLRAEAVVNAAAGCYDYQSCEHPGYENSKARQFVTMLHTLTENAEGKGPWGIDNRDAFVVGSFEGAVA